jgi:hypothetical protein
LSESEPREERARFVGGPMDGQGVTTDSENPTLPDHLVADGGHRPAGYQLFRGKPDEEWQYVLDQAVGEAYMVELWGWAGARAYYRVLGETGDTKQALKAAGAAKDAEERS